MIPEQVSHITLGAKTKAFVNADVLIVFAGSAIVALAGFCSSSEFMVATGPHSRSETVPTLASGMLNWDGARYRAIAFDAYSHDDLKRAATFPGYPFVARAVAATFQCSTECALLLTSNLSFLIACSFLYRYVHITRDNSSSASLAELAVSLLCFWPLAVFFHVGYSESFFLATAVIAFYGMERQWPAPVIGAVIGLTTGTRLVGLGLVLVFADHLWRSGRLVQRPLSSAAGLLLSCWGIVGFMILLQTVYGDPLMFVTAQGQFVLHHDMPVDERIFKLITLEPIWSVFNPNSLSYWESPGSSQNPVFNVRFLNPIVFCSFCAIVAVGWWKGAIRRGEAIFSLVALGLPFVGHSIQGGMLSQARYASVVFPAYIAMATLLRHAPASMLISLAAIGAALLFAFSALFGAGYEIY